MSDRFKDRVVVITGGSGGIGAAAARRFADEGARLVLAARGAERLEATADDLRARGAQVLALPTDVGDNAACAHLIQRAVERFGGLDVLVNNAAMHTRGLFEKNAAEAYAQMVDINLRAPIYLTRLALPHLLVSGRGAVVHVASLAGRVPLPGSVVYSATKFGLRAFSRALAEELRDQGVSVSVVSPGPVATDFILDDLTNITNLTLSQPMRTADQIAALVVDCAAEGPLERAEPRLSGVLSTLGYLSPRLSRALRPLLERKGRRVRARLVRERQAGRAPS